tara:strand:- start:225 stop:641 length:417 start_codon:yes stop_codon:yes gene_type:complete
MSDIEIIYIGDLRTKAEHLKSGVVWNTDAPVDNMGKGESFSPTDMLATALGSCMLTIMGIKANQHNLDIKNTKVEVRKKMGENPRMISKIELKIIFANDIEIKYRKLLERAAHQCPVSKSIHPNIDESVEFIYSGDCK